MLATRRCAMTAPAASALTTGGPWVLSGGLPAARAAAVQTGAVAPAFTGTDTKGVVHTLAGYRGKIVVTRNYVREALDALAAGRPIAARPYGRSVKY